MKVRFIGHAGICVNDEDTSIVVDPWFVGSSLRMPILKSIIPANVTIDYLRPSVNEKIEEYKVNGLLLSHFHAHHSPEMEVATLIKNGSKPLLFSPRLQESLSSALLSRLKEENPDVQIHFPAHKESIKIGSCNVTAYEHTANGHLAYHIQSDRGSVLHLADAYINKNCLSKEIDPLWNDFRGLKPDILFLSSGSHAQRTVKDGKRIILPDTCFTPIDAARITTLIQPKAVAIIGIYNLSLWRNDWEFILPVGVVEEQFQWALSWYAPHIKFYKLNPGMDFLIERKKETTEISVS